MIRVLRPASRACPPRWLRGIAVLLATFGILSQLLGAAHLLLVSHDFCPEHGELLHGHHAVIEGRVFLARQGSRGPEVLPDAGEDDEHEHCFLVSEGRRLQALAPQRSLVPASASMEGPAGEAFGRACPQLVVPLLLLAPKSSPPG